MRTFAVIKYPLHIPKIVSTYRLQKLGRRNGRLIGRKKEREQNKEDKKRARNKKRQKGWKETKQKQMQEIKK